MQHEPMLVYYAQASANGVSKALPDSCAMSAGFSFAPTVSPLAPR